MWVAAADTNLKDVGIPYWNDDKVEGTALTSDTAFLADVVGSRTIKVKATLDSADGGGDVTSEAFTFGDGPLSVFTKTGVNGPVGRIQWATHQRSMTGGGTSNFFQDSGNSFPAAEFCTGRKDSVNRNVTTDSAGSGPNSSGFTPNAEDWSEEYIPPGITTTITMKRYALSSKLAKAEQLLRVSVYHSTNAPKSKSAAIAAGWSIGLGSSNIAWTGEVDYYYGYYNGENKDNFFAVAVGLNTGDVDRFSVNYNGGAAVCLP
jgi:hypothetical protein